MIEDEPDQLQKTMRKVVEGFKELKECGATDEILLVYVKAKTGLSYRDCRKMMEAVDEFYETYMKYTVAKSI